MGVFHPDLVGIQARVLQRLGSRHVMVVYGMEGLDEISIAGETMVGELKDDEVREYVIHPRQFGLQTADLSSIRVSDGAQSRELVLAALEGRSKPARDIVALNAGAAIYVSGLADSLEQGVEKALALVASGAARRKVDDLVAFTTALRA
jgi:anthranilate phosphoribosyltransferase